VLGSTGNLVGHPAVKMAREAEADAHRYAVELLLTPASRARAKIGRGDEPDDDGLDGLLG
jgi:phage terminase small subunit